MWYNKYRTQNYFDTARKRNIEKEEVIIVNDNVTSGGKQAKGRPKGKLKNGRTISCYIRNDIYEVLIRHCEITGQTKTIAIERAIEKMAREDQAEVQDGGK